VNLWVVLSAVVIGLAIAWLGITALRAASGASAPAEEPEVEDVSDLEVYLVCEECGTAIHPGDARLLFLNPVSSHTFCSPECLRRYQTRDGLYSLGAT